MAALPGVPGVAPAAMREGRNAARVIRAGAVAQTGRLRLTGFGAFMAWGFVQRAYLVGWGNRFEAVGRWMWTLPARNRRERLTRMAGLVSDEQVREELAAIRRRAAA
jgi:NADH dehydrogenase